MYMGIIQFSDNIRTTNLAISADTDTNIISLVYTANPSQDNLRIPWVPISSTLYGVNIHGNWSTSWKIFRFTDASNVTVYNIPRDIIDISDTPPSESTVLNAIKNLPGTSGTYTGILPTMQIDQSRQEINAKMDEFFKIQGSYIESIESNYQSTLMMGIVVAMFGTTVLFYTFRQL